MRALLVVTILSACAARPLPALISNHRVSPPPRSPLDDVAFLDGCWTSGRIEMCWSRQTDRWIGYTDILGAVVLPTRLTIVPGPSGLVFTAYAEAGDAVWWSTQRGLEVTEVGRDKVRFAPRNATRRADFVLLMRRHGQLFLSLSEREWLMQPASALQTRRRVSQ